MLKLFLCIKKASQNENVSLYLDDPAGNKLKYLAKVKKNWW